MEDEFYVNFSPSKKEIEEIENWLIEERNNTGEGFYCNWTNIISSFKKNEMVTISYKNSPIGFTTFCFSTEKIARIDISEVKPSFRTKGIGKKMIEEVLRYLKKNGIYIVYLQCSPRNSEPIWKALGFIEFPEAIKYNYFNPSYEKQFFKILTDHFPTSSCDLKKETIELWNNEPYATNEDTPPTYIWNLDFVEETRQLLKPIINPGNKDWRFRWRINGKTIKDDKVKRFGLRIDFGDFIIIEEMPR